MRQRRAFLTASAARAVTVALIALRAKAVALMLGPEGTGLLGLFTAAQEIGAQATDAGLSHSAVRQIARTADRPARAARLRRALAIAVVTLAVIGMLSTFYARGPLSRLLTGTEAHAPAFAVLSLGLFLTVLYRWRQALLTGYRQLGALAGGSVLGTALATGAGLALVWIWGRDGLAWAAVALPACGLLALGMLGRLPAADRPPSKLSRVPMAGRTPGGPGSRPGKRRGELPGLTREWAVLLRLGVSLMLVALTALVAPMVLRVWLTHQDGLAQAGLFHAGWTISAQLMAVLLMAVGIDFYPSISARISDRTSSSDLLLRQVRMHLAAGGPALVLTAGLAPWVLTLLYARDFVPAAPLLQGLAVGNLARLVSAPLETVLTAAGRPRTVLGIAVLSLTILLAGAIALTPEWGLAGIGTAFALAQFVHLGLLAAASGRLTGLMPDTAAMLWVTSLAGAVLVASQAPPIAALAIAALTAIPAVSAARPAVQRFLGLTSTAGRRSSAALNRLKVWLT